MGVRFFRPPCRVLYSAEMTTFIGAHFPTLVAALGGGCEVVRSHRAATCKGGGTLNRLNNFYRAACNADAVL